MSVACLQGCGDSDTLCLDAGHEGLVPCTQENERDTPYGNACIYIVSIYVNMCVRYVRM